MKPDHGKVMMDLLRRIADRCLQDPCRYELMGAVTAAMRHRDHPRLHGHLKVALALARKEEDPEVATLERILQELASS